MTRIEVFKSVDPTTPDERSFVAILQATDGKRISVCMNFFGPTAEGVEHKATAWIAAERDRHDKANAEAAARRMSRRARLNAAREMV